MSADNLAVFLDGGRVTLGLLIAIAFLRLGRTTGDRLYHGFAVAFVLMSVSNVLVGLGLEVGESQALVYVPRLCAFLLIIAAIVDKNRRSRR